MCIMVVYVRCKIVASELKDPICHSDECQIGSFSSEATRCIVRVKELVSAFRCTTIKHILLYHPGI